MADSAKKQRAPRNPEGRKQAIVEAAADIISHEGTKKVTNRSVAELAGVPLGSTTQYFKNIEELRAAGLAEVVKRVQSEYDQVFQVTEVGLGNESLLVDAINDYLADPDLIRADTALRVAAIEDLELRTIAKDAFSSFLSKCETLMNRQKALILFAFIEGVILNSAIANVTYNRETVEKAVRLIINSDL